MADAAFKTAAYPAYTTADLSRWLAAHTEGKSLLATDQYHAVCNELTRRGKVASGDVSVMTSAERLRHNKAA